MQTFVLQVLLKWLLLWSLSVMKCKCVALCCEVEEKFKRTTMLKFATSTLLFLEIDR